MQEATFNISVVIQLPISQLPPDTNFFQLHDVFIADPLLTRRKWCCRVSKTLKVLLWRCPADCSTARPDVSTSWMSAWSGKTMMTSTNLNARLGLRHPLMTRKRIQILKKGLTLKTCELVSQLNLFLFLSIIGVEDLSTFLLLMIFLS